MGKNTGWSTATATLKNRKLIGQQAEDKACIYLERQGLRLIKRNYLCRFGEIDLVMQDGLNLVFVEVRCRKPSIFGTAAETVTRTKQHKLIKAAMCYLREYGLSADKACRFDVVAIMSGGCEMQISWIKDAFQE